MTDIEFCEYIKTQESFTQMVKQYKPKLVFLAGSRGCGVSTPQSDYDLIVITSHWKIQSILGCDEIKLATDQVSGVHCYIYSLDYCYDWLNDTKKYPHNSRSDLWFQNYIALQNKDYIILNLDSNCVKFWFDNKQHIIKKSLHNLFNIHWPYLNKNGKFLGHCAMALSLASNKPICHQNIIAMKKLKYEDCKDHIRKELLTQWNEYLMNKQ